MTSWFVGLMRVLSFSIEKTYSSFDIMKRFSKTLQFDQKQRVLFYLLGSSWLGKSVFRATSSVFSNMKLFPIIIFLNLLQIFEFSNLS